MESRARMSEISGRPYWWGFGVGLTILAPTLLLATLLLSPAKASAQQADTLRIALAEDPRVGRPMPPVVLPYVIRTGPGPVEQPFDLAKELGRVVVLVFRGEKDPVSPRARWKSLRSVADSTAWQGVVLAAVSGLPMDSIQRQAAELNLDYKLLHDQNGQLARRLDLNPAASTVLVVARDGRLVYRENRLPLSTLLSMPDLAAAIKTASEIP